MSSRQDTPEYFKWFVDRHAVRSLDKDTPELKPYLTPGASVLDVGCGPGSITIDVADAVKPGRVVGVDPVGTSIEAAGASALSRKAANVSFLVADGLSLPFADATFDVVYSHTVLHYFNDPESAVREQKRVTKRGGRVIAAGVRDTGLVRRYPPCPAWDRVEEARAVFADRQRDLPKTAALAVGQMHAGRRCAHYFTAAGLADLKIELRPYRILHQGAAGMEPHPMDALPWSLPDETGHFENMSRDYSAMIAEGLIDRHILQEAMQEARAWYSNPASFCFYVLVSVAGRV